MATGLRCDQALNFERLRWASRTTSMVADEAPRHHGPMKPTLVMASSVAALLVLEACAPTQEYECVCSVAFGPDTRTTIEAETEREAQAECDDLESAFRPDRCVIVDPDVEGTGGAAGSTTASTTAASTSGGGSSDEMVEQTLWDLLEQLRQAIAEVVVDALADEFCETIDNNPNYTSNAIFGAIGKVPFADLARDAYGGSAVLRDRIHTSGYWAAAGQGGDPGEIIGQTSNSCQTNVAFINATCFDFGVQYSTAGSYRATAAPSTGGCDETKH